MESSYVRGNEPPSCIKFREILDTLGNYYLLKMVNAPLSYLDCNVASNTKRAVLFVKLLRL